MGGIVQIAPAVSRKEIQKKLADAKDFDPEQLRKLQHLKVATSGDTRHRSRCRACSGLRAVSRQNALLSPKNSRQEFQPYSYLKGNQRIDARRTAGGDIASEQGHETKKQRDTYWPQEGAVVTSRRRWAQSSVTNKEAVNGDLLRREITRHQKDEGGNSRVVCSFLLVLLRSQKWAATNNCKPLRRHTLDEKPRRTANPKISFIGIGCSRLRSFRGPRNIDPQKLDRHR